MSRIKIRDEKIERPVILKFGLSPYIEYFGPQVLNFIYVISSRFLLTGNQLKSLW